MSELNEEQTAARDATNWAKTVSRLDVSDMPDEAVNRVTGKRLVGPIQGFGKMWQKTYQAQLPLDVVAPTALVSTWRQHFNSFWPDGHRFYAPLTGIEPGEVALINAPLPGGLKLSTGVMVLYSDEESFTLMTPEGHVFAGWITFSATERDGATVAQVQLLMRAADPICELGLALGGHSQENQFWVDTLTRLSQHFDVDNEVETVVVCVDKKRQWSRWTNVFQSSVIWSTGYTLGAPFRAVRGWIRRRRSE